MRERIVFEWKGGEVSVGYLGGHRWRVRRGDQVLESSRARATAEVVLGAVFAGVAPGREAAERSPVRVLAAEPASFVADPRRTNGWTYVSASGRFDLGAHEALLDFVTDLLAKSAERAWAVGVEPTSAPAIGPDFGFDAFARAADPAPLCALLTTALEARLQASPDPDGAFEASMLELRGLGHDLWSFDEGVWCADWTTRRPGAGLTVTHLGDGKVSVSFEPPA